MEVLVLLVAALVVSVVISGYILAHDKYGNVTVFVSGFVTGIILVCWMIWLAYWTGDAR